MFFGGRTVTELNQMLIALQPAVPLPPTHKSIIDWWQKKKTVTKEGKITY